MRKFSARVVLLLLALVLALYWLFGAMLISVFALIARRPHNLDDALQGYIDNEGQAWVAMWRDPLNTGAVNGT